METEGFEGTNEAKSVNCLSFKNFSTLQGSHLHNVKLFWKDFSRTPGTNILMLQRDAYNLKAFWQLHGCHYLQHENKHSDTASWVKRLLFFPASQYESSSLYYREHSEGLLHCLYLAMQYMSSTQTALFWLKYSKLTAYLLSKIQAAMMKTNFKKTVRVKDSSLVNNWGD